MANPLLLSCVVRGIRVQMSSFRHVTWLCSFGLHTPLWMGARVSVSGRQVVPYQRSSHGVVLRAIAGQRRHDHQSDLYGRCRVDGEPAGQCYDSFAAGLVLSAVTESTVSPRSSARAGVALAVSAVVAVAVLAAVWLLWVR